MAYPSRADYNKRKEYNDLANKFFTVEEFLDLYEDPFKHFGDETRATDPVKKVERLFVLFKNNFVFVLLI